VELIYTKIADNYFGKTKTGILSPNPGNTTQIIVEKTKRKLVKRPIFLKFTSKDMAQARAVVENLTEESEEDSAMTKNDLFKGNGIS
jgi:hypothetical protein